MAFVFALGLMACGGSASVYENLQGSWDRQDPVSEDSWKEDLQNMAFYDGEIALADLSALSFVVTLTFNEDKTYHNYLNEEKSRANIENTLKDLFATLYEHRTEITEYYNHFDDAASVDEFMELYATDALSMDSADEMMTSMVDYVAGLYSMEEEKGEFKADSSKLYFKEEGTDEFLYDPYTLDGDTLTLEYKDATYEYVKQQ